MERKAAEERKAVQEAQRAAVERVEAAAPEIMAPPVMATQEAPEILSIQMEPILNIDTAVVPTLCPKRIHT